MTRFISQTSRDLCYIILKTYKLSLDENNKMDNYTFEKTKDKIIEIGHVYGNLVRSKTVVERSFPKSHYSKWESIC